MAKIKLQRITLSSALIGFGNLFALRSYDEVKKGGFATDKDNLYKDYIAYYQDLTKSTDKVTALHDFARKCDKN